MTTESEAGTNDPSGGNADSVPEEGTSNDREANSVVPEPRSTPVLSGKIELEHATFVVLGALATVVVFLQLSGVAF